MLLFTTKRTTPTGREKNGWSTTNGFASASSRITGGVRMSKRFTATEKWDDRWFRALRPELKLAWMYIVDRCDNAGVIEVDQSLADFQIGVDVDWELFLTECGDRVRKMTNGKWWIVGFIPYQQKGVLKGGCRPHQQIIGLLKQHGLLSAYLEHFPKGIERVSKPLGKGPGNSTSNGKGKSKGSKAEEFTPPTVAEVAAYCAERKNRIKAEQFVAHYTAQKWVRSNGQPVKCWKSCVITWEGRENDHPAPVKEDLPVVTARRRP